MLVINPKADKEFCLKTVVSHILCPIIYRQAFSLPMLCTGWGASPSPLIVQWGDSNNIMIWYLGC